MAGDGATHVLGFCRRLSHFQSVVIADDSERPLDTLDWIRSTGVQNQHNTCHHDDDEGYRRCGGACAVAALRSGLGIGGKASIVGKSPLFMIWHSHFSCDLT